MPFELIIFDLDGTLAKVYTVHLLPNVRRFFTLIYKENCQNAPRVAIATNQGGVGLRLLMEKEGWGNPRGYPTVEEIDQRLGNVLDSLGAPPDLPVYSSLSYQTKEGRWTPIPPEGAGDPRWNPEWRKPSPGMLLQAMQDAGVPPDGTLFVGDSPEDESAARAAGCKFQWADDFFAREWGDCSQLARL